MIVSMRRAFIVARQADRKALLEALAHAGLVHIQPIDPAKAVAEEQTLGSLDRAARAIQVLGEHQPSGDRPALTAEQAADEALRIQREQAEAQARLGALHRQIDHLALWGDVQLDQFRQLEQAGVNVTFHSVPARQVSEVRADVVQVLSELPAKRVLVATVMRSGEAAMPEGTEPLPLPQRDRPTLRSEAAKIDQAIRQRQARLGELAHLHKDLQDWQNRLARRAQFGAAERSGLDNPDLYAIQGWVPQDQADGLSDAVRAAGVEAAVQTAPPTDEDIPPTLVRYPAWAKPISGLFDILGTLPGYREYDASPFFMIALPIFAAMLIGDAGYGLLFLLPLLFYRKMAASMGPAKVQLLVVFGGATVLWGMLTATYFGLTPENFANAGYAGLAQVMTAIAPLWDQNPETVRQMLIKLSFLIGTIHLTLAHLRKAAFLAPSQQALADVGWAIFLWGMLGLIWLLFFGKTEPMPVPMGLIYALLIVGGLMAVSFASPHRNLAKRLGLGLANSLLPFLGTFGDTMSYIRLMAVGLASYYIAAAFNNLGAQVAQAMTWGVGIVIVVLGHALNVGLAMIAIFAHGVRLNMLEFSSNAGIQWAGYSYKPFAVTTIEES